jgi:hypothetical protein
MKLFGHLFAHCFRNIDALKFYLSKVSQNTSYFRHKVTDLIELNIHSLFLIVCCSIFNFDHLYNHFNIIKIRMLNVMQFKLN